MKRSWVGTTTLAIALATAALLVVVDLWPSTSGGADRGSPIEGGSAPTLDVGLGVISALDGLEPGRTPGDDAVARLRGDGYLVFDYTACSDDIERGLLVLVSETFTGEIVLDAGGIRRSGERSAVLDVVISDGRSCR